MNELFLQEENKLSAPLKTKKTLIIGMAKDCGACGKFKRRELEAILEYIATNFSDLLNVSYIEKNRMLDPPPASMSYVDYERKEMTYCKINPELAQAITWYPWLSIVSHEVQPFVSISTPDSMLTWSSLQQGAVNVYSADADANDKLSYPALPMKSESIINWITSSV